ncbi:putative baseplate assembly protein [Micromonospora rubida]|uniref:putative baseplate assembly protein n=1 Tax=Micromonospora rubida TaxID=2697657 RepID=UPI001376C8CC|nr:putative baseplate assembly protein [Micromonospora rubida]NBE84931.1 putative baseplate assembly protein [Micromonospora rubida]
MALPAPHLDDRRFQDLVDDAKRLVQRRCPEWTDHNVSDPGVTLIETFAYMVDQLLYRLNRVPDRHYVKFLDLLGIAPFPPAVASTDVTFWLSAPRDAPVVVPAGTHVATVRAESAEPVTFETLHELAVPPCRLARVLTVPAGGRATDRTGDLGGADRIPAFADPPVAGDAVLFGLDGAVPGCAVLLTMDWVVAGRGVDPTNPPLVWEAWTEGGWEECPVERDTTGALNRAGEVVLHVPARHAASVEARHRAGWLRCRLREPVAGQPFFHAPPRLGRAEAVTIGGTVSACHAELIGGETLGASEGVPGQRFTVQRAPIVAADGAIGIEVGAAEGWQTWREVASFADSGPEDRHVCVDRSSGEIGFGPAVRQADGTVRRYGAVPPKGAVVRIPAYRTGGGRQGNVAARALSVLRDPVPFVSTVTNRAAATGGVDGESLAETSVRGPLSLRTRERAVTAEDYEQLAREAAPEVLRVKCVPAGDGSAAVRVLVVPALGEHGDAEDDAARFAALRPRDEVLDRIRAFLDARRCVGARVLVEPPFYQGVTVVARVRARPRVSTSAAELRRRALRALYDYLDPVRGGPDGDGWPFGRPIQSGELHAVLQRVDGVDLVEEVRLFGADPTTGERGEAVQRIELDVNAIAFSYAHQVRVTG